MIELSHLLQVLLLLGIVIFASKAAGALSKRMGQPAVFGELLAGLLLGPTLINILDWPVFHGSQEYLHDLIHDLAELGVIFLMFLAGLETDLAEMRRVGTAATVGAIGGMVFPFLFGMGTGLLFGYDLYASAFIGTILTATSVSISAQTLLELGQLRSRVGTTILGAAVIDDVLGILLLSIVVALQGGGSGQGGPVWLVGVRMIAFFVAAVLVGRYLVPPFLRATRHWAGSEVPFAMAVVLGLVFAFAAEAFGGVAAITGSYTLGVLIGQRPDLKPMVEEKLKHLAYGFFVPIFFINVGLSGNLVEALRESGAGFTLLILLGAVAGKVIGCGLGVKLLGFSWVDALRVGVGMISRGEVGLIVAGLGLSTGVIGQAVYSVMVVMVLFTTLVTPILLRLAYRGTTPAVPARVPAEQ